MPQILIQLTQSQDNKILELMKKDGNYKNKSDFLKEVIIEKYLEGKK